MTTSRRSNAKSATTAKHAKSINGKASEVKNIDDRKQPSKHSSALYICRSCVWSEEKRELDGKRQGEYLFQNVKQLFLNDRQRVNMVIRGVYCLNGCKRPCNVAFRGPNKHGLRYSNLNSENAADIVDYFISYTSAKKGIVNSSNTPKSMRDKLTVKTPPPKRR